MSTKRDHLTWRSCGNAACVEVAMEPTAVHMRDSTNRTGPELVFSPDAWDAFVRDIKAGHFDRPAR
jgi:Domain of unknown function (DUF397)